MIPGGSQPFWGSAPLSAYHHIASRLSWTGGRIAVHGKHRVGRKLYVSRRPARSFRPHATSITYRWLRNGHKIRIRYRNEQGDENERIVWPTMIGYAETVRLLAAWCELRQDFRHFRTDRISAATFLDERIGCRPGELRNRWKRHMAAQGIQLPQG